MSMSAIDVSASGMRAQRLRMDLIANNLANAETTSSRTETVRTETGETYVRHVPYRRQMAVFVQGMDPDNPMMGVSVPQVVDDPAPFRPEFDPSHKHAVPAAGGRDAGIVYYPNVNSIVEMVDMMTASRAYEANVSAVDTLKSMQAAALRILA